MLIKYVIKYSIFNSFKSGFKHCFKPAAPIDVGMAAGLAVGITFIVLGLAAGGFFAFKKFGNPFSESPTSFSNPNA